MLSNLFFFKKVSTQSALFSILTALCVLSPKKPLRLTDAASVLYAGLYGHKASDGRKNSPLTPLMGPITRKAQYKRLGW